MTVTGPDGFNSNRNNIEDGYMCMCGVKCVIEPSAIHLHKLNKSKYTLCLSHSPISAGQCSSGRTKKWIFQSSV